MILRITHGPGPYINIPCAVRSQVLCNEFDTLGRQQILAKVYTHTKLNKNSRENSRNAKMWQIKAIFEALFS